MPTVEWSEVKNAPQGLRSGEQNVEITSVREYTNPNGNRCIELMLENDEGGRLPLFYSIEGEHWDFIEKFLHDFLQMTIMDVLRQGLTWIILTAGILVLNPFGYE